jgi:hypothetical protein
VLRARTTDPDLAVRTAALDALRELGDAGELPTLVERMLHDEVLAAREAAFDAVVAVGRRVADETRRMAALRAAWGPAGDAERAVLVRAAGKLGGAAALDFVRNARHYDDVEVVEAAVRALAAWPTAAALDELYDIAQAAAVERHRLLALRGYIRAVGLAIDRPAEQRVALYRAGLELARRPDEQRLILSGLAEIPALAALELVGAYLEEPGVRSEAELATVQSARRIGLEHTIPATVALETVMAQSERSETRDAAEAALQYLRAHAGLVVTWQISGTYRLPDRGWEAVYDTAFPPEDPAAAGEVAWRALPVSNHEKPWIFDLAPRGDRDCCVYVRCVVLAPVGLSGRLYVGSDDAVKAWVNGVLVHENKVIRGHNPLVDEVPVTLNPGWNTLMLKVVQAEGGWGFSAAILDAEREPIPGVRFRATAPPER